MPQTPSARRRLGREAFEPFVDPRDVDPFRKNSFAHDMYFSDFLDGWHEAVRNYQTEQQARRATRKNRYCSHCGARIL